MKIAKVDLDLLSIEAKTEIAKTTNNNAVLEYLAKDSSVMVKKAVADNVHSRCEILNRLSRDEDWTVRAAVAHNEGVSLQTLSRLASDDEFYVRMVAHGNPKMLCKSSSVLLNDEDEDQDIRRRIAHSTYATEKQLHVLAYDRDFRVRELVAMNEKTAEEDIVMLTRDSVTSVRYAARRRLNNLVDIEIVKSKQHMLSQTFNTNNA